jgi:hypothetical protein
VNLLNSALSGIPNFPDPNDANNKWISYLELHSAKIHGIDSTFVRNIMPLYLNALDSTKVRAITPTPISFEKHGELPA